MEDFFVGLVRLIMILIFVLIAIPCAAVARLVWICCHLINFLSPTPKR